MFSIYFVCQGKTMCKLLMPNVNNFTYANNIFLVLIILPHYFLKFFSYISE